MRIFLEFEKPVAELEAKIDELRVMAGADSIRDVIAFPKTQTAACPMTDAPTEVSERQLKELNIRIRQAPTAS